jgi:hypothetical protein
MTPTTPLLEPQPRLVAPHRFTADSFRSRPKTRLELNIWNASARLAKDALEEYGNVLSRDHWHAIQSLSDVFTAVTFGAVGGRYAVALPTGTGKSMSAVMFLVALHRYNRPESVAICAEKVQQLITFKRELLKWGVPEDKIGLWYSDNYRTPDGKRPSEPRTSNPEARQFLLLTHARTRGRTELARLNTYHGEPRSLWVYDESLLASSHVAFDMVPFVNAVSWFRSVAETWQIRKRHRQQDQERKARLIELADYLEHQAVPMLKQELLAQVTEHRAPRLLTLPHVPEARIAEWQEDLRPVYGRNMRHAGRLASTLQKFNRMMHGFPLRIVAVGSGESAVVSFAIVVPEQLQRLVVLDASYPVRLLENMDKRITHVTGFEDIKDWTDVSMTIEKGASGRDPISSNFAEHARWAIEKINKYAPDPVLVLTFKDRPDTEDMELDERTMFRKRETKLIDKFKQQMEEAGVKNPERVQFLTFGNETSLSDFKHISHVIFLGVLHRSQTDLMGAILGQSDDLLRSLDEDDVIESSLGEQAHGIYQGLSRGTCRTMVNGKAMPMTVDIRHHSPHKLWSALAPVLRGCTPTLPPPPPSAHREQDARALLAALVRLEEGGQDRIALRSLKPLAGLDHLDGMTYTRTVTFALEQQTQGGWMRQGRTLVRLFTDETDTNKETS